MEFFAPLWDVVLYLWDVAVHLDKHLAALLAQYGIWVYAILFFIIFAETGFVVTPFLPGDSLLFVAGALCGAGAMDLWVLNATLIAAAILGNSVNYSIGRYLGPKVFQWENSRFFNKAALMKTHVFYERHGGKALVISRFIPILRTFTPFVAGIGEMTYVRFQAFNVAGAVLWVVSLSVAGYLFGNLPFIQNNLSLVILAIIVVSTLPALIGYLKHRAAQ
ncbi:MAG: DedA family protein [Rhodocyclaceae bacterium]|jgi:membrane-associated protein|nr:Protein DedA [Rhodocyclaceae bacterium]MBZ0144037.1 DedA family protein [Rhodocyclaceae bacterium]MCC6879960.1 DedA family protein [Rhodocyclaceae bacterium]MCL4681485.1 DedA family protein [Rhodocyclaceae bacterium]